MKLTSSIGKILAGMILDSFTRMLLLSKDSHSVERSGTYILAARFFPYFGLTYYWVGGGAHFYAGYKHISQDETK